MDDHGISATWAIVGHLFLSSCSATGGISHAELRRPEYPWYEGDWYDLDPASSLTEDPTWYGSDLVDMVKHCAVDQEIGSHSFGHIIAGDPDCDEEAFKSDLEACIALAGSAGLSLASYVYPRNSIGHLGALEESGFSAYRGAPRDAGSEEGSVRRRLESLIRIAFPQRHIAEHPRHQGGLVNVPQTYLFDPGSRTAGRLGTDLWSFLLRRRLEGAIRTGSLFHLWFHTHNLATNEQRAFVALDDLFRFARLAMDAGRLENLTMSQVAGRFKSEV